MGMTQLPRVGVLILCSSRSWARRFVTVTELLLGIGSEDLTCNKVLYIVTSMVQLVTIRRVVNK